MHNRMQGNAGYGPESVVVLPIAWLLCATLTGVYGAALALNPFAIANPIAVLAVMMGQTYLASKTAYFARARGKAGTFLALAFTPASILGALAGASFIDGHAFILLDVVRDRFANGYTLFGSGTFAVKGWLLVVCWVLVTFLHLVALAIGFEKQANSAFCESCNKWAGKKVWDLTISGLPIASVKRAGSQENIPALVALLPTHEQQAKTRLWINSCSCGQAAGLWGKTWKAPDENEGEQVFAGLPFRASEALSFFEWAERVYPGQCPQRPSLQLSEAPSGPREPFVLPSPLGERRNCSYRWSGSNATYGATHDNDITKSLRARLKKGDFQAGDEALDAATHADDRAMLIQACADWASREGVIEAWEVQSPNSPMLTLARGIYWVERAWTTRGSGWTPKDYPEFQRQLEIAEEALRSAIEWFPEDATPWAWLIHSGMGLQVGQNELQNRFREMFRREPGQRQGAYFMVQAMSAKWGGNTEAMITFAQKVSQKAPPGRCVHAVVVDAYMEASPQGHAESSAYFRSPEVSETIALANDRCFSPGAVPTMETPRARAQLAYGLWKAGLVDQARAHLSQIEKDARWGFFSAKGPGGKESLARAKKECGC